MRRGQRKAEETLTENREASGLVGGIDSNCKRTRHAPIVQSAPPRLRPQICATNFESSPFFSEFAFSCHIFRFFSSIFPNKKPQIQDQKWTAVILERPLRDSRAPTSSKLMRWIFQPLKLYFLISNFQVKSTTRVQRVAAHSHVKGLGLHPETQEALPKVRGKLRIKKKFFKNSGLRIRRTNEGAHFCRSDRGPRQNEELRW